MKIPLIKIDLPEWIENFIDWDKQYAADADKMIVAINLSRENVVRKTGGPFGAAIFESATGKIVSVGVNQVVRLNNSCLHAETTAIMIAENKINSYSLGSTGATDYELFTSCEPCCMCLGATLWSGVRRIVCAATKDDASRIGFDEGPVYESSYHYLKERGIAVKRNLLRDEAVKAFDLYRESGGVIYNR